MDHPTLINILSNVKFHNYVNLCSESLSGDSEKEKRRNYCRILKQKVTQIKPDDFSVIASVRYYSWPYFVLNFL